MTATETNPQVQQWTQLAQQLRVDSIRCTTAAGSGHPTSSMSAADLMAVLMISYLRYDFDNPKHPNNDHLIFSKGHASPLLYALYKAAGAISDEELLTLRKFGSRLEGHPVPVLPWVDVATGALGQGLPIGVGIGLAGKYLDHLPYRVWVLMGDSEVAEGRARAFGWNAVVIDGHDFGAIDAAYAEAVDQNERPTLIVARTVKGKGVSFVENKEGKHGVALKPEEAEAALRELGGVRH